MDEDRIETLAVHGGERRPGPEGSVVYPIYQGTVYSVPSGTDYHDLRYIRLNSTPSQSYLHDKLAALEGAEAGLVASSGMGVISAAILGLVCAGDHIVASDALYSVADEFMDEDLPRLGIDVTRVDVSDLGAVRSAIRDNTRILYTEFLSNPKLKVADVPSLASIARERELVSIVDNTFATPYVLRPVEHGIDLVVHSATKYISGHGDVVAGALCGCQKYVACARRMVAHLGSPNSPFNSWLLLRGIKTLELRVERHCQNAMEVARFLDGHPDVTTVYYPGLESHPGHEVVKRLTGGRFGGMLSFEIEGGSESAQRFADVLELCAHAVSLGDVSTLVWPTSGSNLVRVSVGVETVDDIIADFSQALFRIG